MKSWIPALFGVLIGVLLTLCTLSGLWWGISAEQNWLAASSHSSNTASNSNVAAEEDLLKEKLETYIKRADDLERVLELLVVVSGISAAALYLKALQDAKQSSIELIKIVQDAEAKFPIFKEMDSKITEILEKLKRLLPGVDVDLANARPLDETLKQEIPYYEMTVAASEYFSLGSMRPDISQIYHRFGKYYVLHSKLPTPQPNAASTTTTTGVSQQDLAWARFYFHRAIELDPKNTLALNDLGYLEQVSKHADEARTAFHKSLEMDPNQQRARYNLATLELDDPQGDLNHSIQLISEALRAPHWQSEQPAAFKAELLYQRACARSKWGQKFPDKKRTEFFKWAMDDLEAAFNVRERNFLELEKAFCGKDGKSIDADLTPLALHPDTKSRFHDLQKQHCYTK